MATKKNDASKRKSTDAKPAPKKKGAQLSDKDLDKVSGGRMASGAESCKETADTGMMGCPS